MKAAVVEDRDRLTVRDVPTPVPGEYEALCEILFGAMCTGTDTHLLHRDPPYCNWMKFPMIIGHESVGRVVEVGGKVRNIKPGDLVTRVGTPAVGNFDVGWGGFAEYGIAVDWRAMADDGAPEDAWRQATVNRVLPPDIDPAAATMFITWRETLSYITRMGMGENVAVVGSGGNGLSFAAHAVNSGAATVVMVGSPARKSHSERIGCHGFVDYKSTEAKDAALSSTPSGFDCVVDAVGNPESAALALSLVKDGGRLGIYGLDGAGRVSLDPNGGIGTYTIYNGGYAEGETHEEIVSYYEKGKLDASVWLNLESPFPLAAIAHAFEAGRSRRIVKPLVKITDQ